MPQVRLADPGETGRQAREVAHAACGGWVDARVHQHRGARRACDPVGIAALRPERAELRGARLRRRGDRAVVRHRHEMAAGAVPRYRDGLDQFERLRRRLRAYRQAVDLHREVGAQRRGRCRRNSRPQALHCQLVRARPAFEHAHPHLDDVSAFQLIARQPRGLLRCSTVGQWLHDRVLLHAAINLRDQLAGEPRPALACRQDRRWPKTLQIVIAAVEHSELGLYQSRSAGWCNRLGQHRHCLGQILHTKTHRGLPRALERARRPYWTGGSRAASEVVR